MPSSPDQNQYRELKVWVDEKPVGVLARAEGPGTATSFRYLPDVPPELAVSLTMLVRPRSFEFPYGLHPIFAQNLPEGDARDRINNHFGKHTERGRVDDFDLLRITGGAQVGRLRFSDVTATQAPEGPARYDFGRLLSEDSETLFEDLLALYEGAAGLSGVQPKTLVDETAAHSSDSGDGLCAEKVAVATRRFIVKTWGERFPELAVNEHFCLRASEHAGIPTVRSWLSQDRRRLVVGRFDYDETDQTQLAFEEAQTLVGKLPEDKYTGSYEKIAGVASDFTTAKHRLGGIKQVFDMLALSCMLENGDFHMKNTGVLYEKAQDKVGAGAWIAPNYDVVTTTVYIPSDEPALTLDGKKKWPDQNRLVKFAKYRCAMQPKKTEERLAELGEGVVKASEELLEYVQHEPELAGFAAGMMACWSRGLGRLEASQNASERVSRVAQELAVMADNESTPVSDQHSPAI